MATAGQHSSARPAKAKRPLYRSFGFKSRLKFVLFLVFAGLMSLFAVRRLHYIDIDGVYCGSPARAVPGECFWYGPAGIYRVGMRLHLAAMLPAGILACWQFVPAVRHRFMTFHRINGYIILLLSAVGTLGAIIISRHAMGGTPVVQSGTIFISLLFLASLAKAHVSVRRTQLDQHREWMLRAWFYAGSIITMRLVMIISGLIISSHGEHYQPFQCEVVDYLTLGDVNATMATFSGCSPHVSRTKSGQWTMVRANMHSGSIIETVAALQLGFAVGGWLSIAIHAIGIELYLCLTSAESERLRTVSCQRRKLKNTRKVAPNADLLKSQLNTLERSACLAIRS